MEKDPDFVHCALSLREGDYAKYIACLYLPTPLRQAAFCLFLFDLEIAKINQLVSEPMIGEIRVQWWRDVVAGKNNPAGNPVAQALMKTVKRWGLPVLILDRYLNARIFDLYNDPMPDNQALETYLGETRSSLFRLLTLCADLSNEDETTICNACGHAGVSIGIIELLQHLAMNHANQRNFFPADISGFSQFKQSKPTPLVNVDWFNDVIDFAKHHHQLATKSINQLEPTYQSLFIILSLASFQHAKNSLGGILVENLSKPQLKPQAKIALQWRLWRAARSIKPCNR